MTRGGGWREGENSVGDRERAIWTNGNLRMRLHGITNGWVISEKKRLYTGLVCALAGKKQSVIEVGTDDCL